MGKKRKNRGRSKGSKGRGKKVQCSICGRIVPEDKTKRITKKVSFIEPTLARELRKQGVYIPEVVQTRYYCVSCSVHRSITPPRKKDKRKNI